MFSAVDWQSYLCDSCQPVRPPVPMLWWLRVRWSMTVSLWQWMMALYMYILPNLTTIHRDNCDTLCVYFSQQPLTLETGLANSETYTTLIVLFLKKKILQYGCKRYLLSLQSLQQLLNILMSTFWQIIPANKPAEDSQNPRNLHATLPATTNHLFMCQTVFAC